jgi:hypothetical protein
LLRCLCTKIEKITRRTQSFFSPRGAHTYSIGSTGIRFRKNWLIALFFPIFPFFFFLLQNFFSPSSIQLEASYKPRYSLNFENPCHSPLLPTQQEGKRCDVRLVESRRFNCFFFFSFFVLFSCCFFLVPLLFTSDLPPARQRL